MSNSLFAPTLGFAQVNGASLHYEALGKGQPLVLIHAGIADKRMWDDQFTALAQRYYVIRYEVRGFGTSGTLEEPTDPAPAYSDHEDLKGLLDFLKIEQTGIIGVSNGGRIAIDFALAYPQKVKALVLVCPALGGYEFADTATNLKDAAADAAFAQGDVVQAIELNLQLWVDGPGRSPEQVNPAVRQRVSQMLQALCDRPEDQGERQPLQPPALNRLKEVVKPTLVIVGDKDVPDMLVIADLLTTGIRGAKKVVMSDVAHLPNMEKPDQFNQIVLDFLQAVEGEPTHG